MLVRPPIAIPNATTGFAWPLERLEAICTAIYNANAFVTAIATRLDESDAASGIIFPVI